MIKGFIFDHNRCVGCRACSAACILENHFSFQPRTIFTFNPEALPSLPLINLSMACNHCDKAVCLEGCPSFSYSRDPVTGAVVTDSNKCIGCRYCQWNCPYEAPRYLEKEGVVSKCHLCYQQLAGGLLPACSTACPTGALKFGELSNPAGNNLPSWLPDRKLNPSVEFTGNLNPALLQIVPEPADYNDIRHQSVESPSIGKEWSLIAFTFLTSLSVALIISSFIRGVFPGFLLFLSIITGAGAMSLLHLGRPSRGWRAILNVRTSPLSREIVVFIIYCTIASLSVLLGSPGLLLASAVTGLVLAVAIDRLYIYSDSRKSVILHSGQTLLTVLLIASFLAGIRLPFIFIAVIKLALSLYALVINRSRGYLFALRYVRVALLILTGCGLFLSVSYPDSPLIFLFLAGELLDRTLFYIDFKPLNITGLINNQVIPEKS
jgi:Fe-S-cluster-containing dehydrogenase component